MFKPGAERRVQGWQNQSVFPHSFEVKKVDMVMSSMGITSLLDLIDKKIKTDPEFPLPEQDQQ